MVKLMKKFRVNVKNFHLPNKLFEFKWEKIVSKMCFKPGLVEIMSSADISSICGSTVFILTENFFKFFSSDIFSSWWRNFCFILFWFWKRAFAEKERDLCRVTRCILKTKINSICKRGVFVKIWRFSMLISKSNKFDLSFLNFKKVSTLKSVKNS